MSNKGSVMVVPLGDQKFDKAASDALRAQGWRVLVARNWRWAQSEVARRQEEFDAVLISASDKSQFEAFAQAYPKAASGGLPPLLVYASDTSTRSAVAQRASVHGTIASSSSTDIMDAVSDAAAVSRAKRRSKVRKTTCECGSTFNSGFHSRWCPAYRD